MKKYHRRLFPQLLFVLFASLSVQAQEAPDTVRLDEVVVTGSKIEIDRKLVPLSVSQFGKDQIEATGEFNVLPVLSQIAPSVFVTQRNILGFGVATGGSGGISIRGVGGAPNNRILVLIDGHPQFMGIFGHPLPDAYVATDVQKIEVLRGPGSMLYGTNAMGGVVNIITDRQESDGVVSKIKMAYGSYNTQQYSGTLGLKKDKWDLFLSANHDRTGGIRENTDFNISNGYIKLGHQISQHVEAVADLNYAHYKANDNGPVFAPAFFGIDIDRAKTAVSINNKFDRISGSLKLYHNFGHHDLTNGFISDDYSSGIMFYQSKRWSEKTLLTLGLDLKRFGGEANQGIASGEKKNINEWGLYSYIQHHFLPGFSISGGLRWDDNSVYGDQWSPFAGAVLALSPLSRFRASVSKGFRSPTMMELYLFLPNPNLQPEKMNNYELSYSTVLNSNLQVELTTFISDGDNFIQVVPQPGGPPKRQNTGPFKNKGIEFITKYFLSSKVYLSANYSFIDYEKPLLAAPGQQFNFMINYSPAHWNLSSTIQYVKDLNNAVAPDTPVTSNYFLWNARASYAVGRHLNIFTRLNNIFDTSYQINNGYPMPGFNVFGGISLKLSRDPSDL